MQEHRMHLGVAKHFVAVLPYDISVNTPILCSVLGSYTVYVG